MVDIPERTESHGPVFIYGVEGEQIEEENDAYNDLRYDIGQYKPDQKFVYVFCYVTFNNCLFLELLNTHNKCTMKSSIKLIAGSN